MFLLALSFLAGVLSVLAACVLPLLPVIVGGSLTTGGARHRIYTIIIALAASIVAFTLLLKASTVLIGVPEYIWQYISGAIIVVLGVFILFPKLWTAIPGVNALYVGSNKALAEGYQRGGFWGDVTMGVALGPVFASCSPTYFLILATVLPAQPLLGFVYLVAYAAGLSLALLLIALAGERLVNRLGITLRPDGWLFRIIGALLIVVGILIFSGSMKKVETWFVERGFDATFIELRILGANESTSNTAEVEQMTQGFLTPMQKATRYQKAPEFVSPDGYINTPRLPSGQAAPITIGEHLGKNVVLIDIWTYSCINCIRTLPYIKAWHERYKDKGLVIIGVHTPEFAFEKVRANVAEAMREYRLEYPVVLDNEYRTWNAFENHFWPRKYLIDIDGYIVYDHAGEGDYDVTERAIQRALAERAARLPAGRQVLTEDSISRPAGVIDVDFSQVQSPEIYFGAWRNERLGNGRKRVTGVQEFTVPTQRLGSTLYLGSSWNIEEEYAKNTVPGAEIRFIYGAKDVYMVAAASKGAVVRVTRDGGKALGSDAGSDVVESGRVRIGEERLYKLIEGSAYETHELEITVESGTLEVYTFTFG